MKRAILVSLLLLGTISTAVAVSHTSVSATTDEQNIGNRFCQMSTVSEADKYIGELANLALSKYEEALQKGYQDVDKLDYYYGIVNVGIKDFCKENKHIVSKLITQYKKKLKDFDQKESLNKQEQDEYNLTFRKLFCLTLKKNLPPLKPSPDENFDTIKI